MTSLYRFLIPVCWAGGLLVVLLGLLIRLVAPVAHAIPFSTRGLLILAGTLFLGALATGDLQKQT